MTTDDMTIIAQYIARCRSFGLGHRLGGLQWMYEDGNEALEALRRIKQPTFWSQFPRDEDESDTPDDSRSAAAQI
jgi:hypothetical protein